MFASERQDRLIKRKKKIEEYESVRKVLLFEILEKLDEQGKSEEIEIYQDMPKADLESAIRQMNTPLSNFDGYIIDEATRKAWVAEGENLPEILQLDLEEMGIRIPEIEAYMHGIEQAENLRPHIAYSLVQEERREQLVSPVPIPVEETVAWKALQIIKKTDRNPLFDWAERYQKKVALMARKAKEKEEEAYVTPKRKASPPSTPDRSRKLKLTPKDLKEVGCVVCGDKVESRCKACKSAYYCSNDCRKFHKMTTHSGCKA